eukprot:COSAG05_NODE_4507_length_1484_cov_26.297536_2_plen_104_part_00
MLLAIWQRAFLLGGSWDGRKALIVDARTLDVFFMNPTGELVPAHPAQSTATCGTLDIVHNYMGLRPDSESSRIELFSLNRSAALLSPGMRCVCVFVCVCVCNI